MLLRTSPCVLVVVSLCARKFTNFTQIYYVAQLINDKVTSSLHFNHVSFFCTRKPPLFFNDQCMRNAVRNVTKLVL